MIKKTLKYTDYNGVEREDIYHFHLSEAELMEMELTTAGGYAEMLQKIVASNDGPELFKIFKDMLLKSYGVKTPDGRGFEKNDELRRSFENSKAYSELAMQLLKDEKAAVDFFNGVIPADLAAQLDQKEKNQNLATHPALK